MQNKPLLNFSNIQTKVLDDVSRKKSKPLKGITKSGKRYTTQKKEIKFRSELMLQIALSKQIDRPSASAYFNEIKRQNESIHNEYFHDELKDIITEQCNELAKTYENEKLAKANELIELVKLGYNLAISNNQHLFPVLEKGKNSFSHDSNRGSKQRLDIDADAFIKTLKSNGEPRHKWNKKIRDEFSIGKTKASELIKKCRE